MLNARDAIRERGHGSLGISLQFTDNPGSSVVGKREVDQPVPHLSSPVAYQIIGLGNRYQGLGFCRNPRICRGSR